MRIVVAGGSGFLGRPLCDTLAAAGHEITVLTRGPDRARGPIRDRHWTPNGQPGPWAAAVDHADAVINLAGEPLTAHRWSAARKRRLVTSRLLATDSLVAAIDAAPTPPAVLLSSSAVGYYGAHGDEEVTEETGPGSGFAARLCVGWERAAERAAGAGTRVTCLRTGLVLGRDGGALVQMALPFRLYIGGPIGSGRQYMPWIHLADWVRLVVWMIDTPAATGPINGTAPTPVTNAAFCAALGRALGRPSWLRAPAFAVRLALGEMATIALDGQRALPARALALGFTFRYRRLDEALTEIYG
ncbi:MAG TPA: TIGR01777 family oxidoreductase [Vicinamibacterales bacterium]|nr:TIGR01777 family oxidoreductase [Vicinamibacterales bacterium]